MKKSKSTESQTLTLEIAGPRITANKFRKTINAFLDVVDEVVNTFSGNSTHVSWVVSVSPGSANIHLTAESTSPHLPSTKVPKLIGTIQGGLTAIETSSVKPPFFSEHALQRVKTLASILDGEIDSIRILWKGQAIRVTQQTTANLSLMFKTPYKSWGSVEGELCTVSKRRGYEFSIYDDVIERSIPCHFQDDLLDEVLKSFGKRVSASGLISYGSDDEIKSIEVEEFERFPDPDTLPGFDDVFGLLKTAR